jgi:hypothetical protein
VNYIRHLNAFFTQLKKDDRLTTSHVSLYLALFQYWNFNRFQNPFPVYRSNMMELSKIGSKNTYHKCIKELNGFGYIRYHPSISRYQPVRISIIRLDTITQLSNYQQLDLFSSHQDPKHTTHQQLPNKETSDRVEASQNSPFTIDHSPHHSPPRVPKSTPACPISGPSQVPKPVPSVKLQNSIKHVSYTPTKKSGKKGKEKESKTAQVPISIHTPTLKEVEEYFQSNHYTLEEAQKFYYYNQAKNWILTGSVPIVNWQAIAQKWMINIGQEGSVTGSGDLNQEIQYLRDRYIQGEKITHLLNAQHFHHLHLQLTPATYQQALQRRMNQLLGSNQHTHLQLYQAYERNDPSDPLIHNDHANLTLLSMRLAILEHFKLV